MIKPMTSEEITVYEEFENKLWLPADEVEKVVDYIYPDLETERDRGIFVEWKKDLKKMLGLK